MKRLSILILALAIPLAFAQTTHTLSWTWKASVPNSTYAGDASYNLYQATGTCPTGTLTVSSITQSTAVISNGTANTTFNVVAFGIGNPSYTQSSFPLDAQVCSFVVGLDSTGAFSGPSNFVSTTTYSVFPPPTAGGAAPSGLGVVQTK